VSSAVVAVSGAMTLRGRCSYGCVKCNDVAYVKCKDRMRAVKRSLKHLGDPDTSQTSESDQLVHTRECLLNIGNHINDVLSAFTDADKVKEWRR